MSVRAYKVIKIETEKEPTFNIWNDIFIYDGLVFCGSEISEEIITVEYDCVKELEKYFQEKKNNALWSAEDVARYQEIIDKLLKDTKEKGYAQYYCY